MLLLSKILSGNKKHIPWTCIHRENALFRVYERTVLDLSRVLFIDIFLTKCLTLCLKLSRVVKNFLPPVLILCQIILGTLIRPGSIFAYETSMQEFTAITDSCMGCADFVHDMCVVHNLFLSPNKVAVDRWRLIPTQGFFLFFLLLFGNLVITQKAN